MHEDNIGQMLQTINLIPMQSVTATGNGTGVDVTQFTGDIAVLLSCKAAGGTSPTLDVKLQDSDAVGGTYTDIPGATFTQVTDAGSSAAVLLKITLQVGTVNKFIRAVRTIGGSATPTFLTACSAVGVQQIR